MWPGADQWADMYKSQLPQTKDNPQAKAHKIASEKKELVLKVNDKEIIY